MLNSWKTIFHFFGSDYAEMRIRLWLKELAKEGALGQISKNFQVDFIHTNIFKKPNQKKLQ